jgi:hypothetical protein
MKNLISFIIALVIINCIYAQNNLDRHRNNIRLNRQNSVIALEGRFDPERIQNAFNVNKAIDPIGWSRNGLFAYRTKWFVSAMPGGGYSVVVFNTVDDEEVEDNGILTYSPWSEFPDDERIAEKRREWQELLAKHGITGEIGNPVEEIGEEGYQNFEGRNFKCWFDYELIYDEYEVIDWKLVVEIGNKQKVVSSGRQYSDSLCGKKILGYYQSPYENRIVIIVVDVGRGFEGEMAVDIKLYGCHMNIGFN